MFQAEALPSSPAWGRKMKFRWASVLTVGTLLLVLVLAGVRGAATVTETRLVPNDGAIGDLFGGLGVSMSGDTAVIGAPGKDSGTGAAYVFVRSGTTWSQQAKLTASDGAPYDAFGTFSSISENTTLVGAPYGGNGTGAAYVFVRSGTTWSQQARLTAGDGASGDGFGGSINGDAAVIGAPGKRRGTGAAYVYVRNGTNWSQEAKLTASDGLPGDLFGLGLSLDGEIAVIGAPGDDDRGTDSGGEGFVADAGTELTYTDTGLTNGVTYYYEVGAVNAVGESPPSSEVSATPATIPSAPQKLEATSSDRRGDPAEH